ncbi:hypothetical protein [Streptomyces sp. YIM 98790]|uniref:hypothetical protein n=1 Tax=Streptomyces sp. YIM 98790 TaxID=2689077 RepID=UPI00140B673E|nr:hypothetical protein [Streptomyces sp. YIM 98790]
MARQDGSGGRLEAAADRLYGDVDPKEFTAVRDELAARARRAGDRQPAQAIARLRKPTIAAWASNLFVRRRPAETAGLLRLGAQLREAFASADRDQVRELTRQQRRLVAALARRAADLAAQEGHRIGTGAQSEIEQTLRAALADEGAARQWASGRLQRPLPPPTAGLVAPGAGPEAAPAARDAQRAEERRRADAERREQEQQRAAERKTARQAAEDTAAGLRAREDEHRRARADAQRAREDADAAHRRAQVMAEQLRRAEKAAQQAGQHHRQAEEQATAAEEAVAGARRRAEEAAAHLKRLGG